MDKIDQAAKRTAINLMRLNEALELRDAEGYSQAKMPSGQQSYRQGRIKNLEAHYRRWFRSTA